MGRVTTERAERAFQALAGGPDEDGVMGAKAPNTWAAYGSAWGNLSRWGEEHGHPILPLQPHHLKLWMRSLLQGGKSAATADSYLAGIVTVHRMHGYALDRTPVIEMLKAARRRSRPTKRASPLLDDQMRKVLATLDPAQPRDARDGALLTLGWAAAMRQNEIATLDYQRAGSLLAGGLGFVTLRDEGIEIVLLSSKAAQLTPVSIPIPATEMPTAVQWLNAWLAICKPAPGEPLFRTILGKGRVTSTRMSATSVTTAIRYRARRMLQADGMSNGEALVAAKTFSGHSLRRGYCSSAAKAGVPEHLIRERSRHGSPAMVAKYIGVAASWQAAGLAKVGF